MTQPTTLWWCYSQNNSGGEFVHEPENGIGYCLFIEATNADHASARAQDIGLYFNGCHEGMDCPCCGDRWSEPWDDGEPVPTRYGEPWRAVEAGEQADVQWGIPSYIHPLNGQFSAAKAVQP